MTCVPGQITLCAAIGCTIRVKPTAMLCMPHLNKVTPCKVIAVLGARDTWERLCARNDAVLDIAIREGRARRPLRFISPPAASQEKPQTPQPVPGDAGSLKESIS